MANAYQAGFEAGRDWIGPNGDGSLGSLSLDFIREQAEFWSCGHRFSDLKDDPDAYARSCAENWMQGHHDGRCAAWELD